MTTIRSRTRRLVSGAVAGLFGVALLGMMAGIAHARPAAGAAPAASRPQPTNAATPPDVAQLAGAAQAASLTLPSGNVHIMSNKGPLQSLTAGAPFLGHAAVYESFENPLNPTPDTMRWVAIPYDGNKTFMLCSKSVSDSIGGPFGIACLGIVNDSTAAGAHLRVAPISDHPSQQWVIENKDPVRPKTLTIRSVWSGKYVDSGPNPQSWDQPTLQNFQQGLAQQWFIKTAKD
jgi:hypothetical protein